MNSPYLKTDLKMETENFEAFDQLTNALTRIDEYQSSEKKELLNDAAGFISKALDADKNYFKAQYFQAVVNYLQNKNADFKKLLTSEPPPEVRNEINYNIAVVNASDGHLDSAITGFDEVIKGKADPEIKLLARAGLALSCSKRMRNWSDDGLSDAEIIKQQYQEIQDTLASEKERLITDEVVIEVEQIMCEALDETLKLRKPGGLKRLPSLRGGLGKRTLFIIGAVVLVLFILWLYLYVGLNNRF